MPFRSHPLFKTFSVGVFEMVPRGSGKGVKADKAKVRVKGSSLSYDAVIAKAHEVADQLDAGTYTGGKVVKL